jgi:hypothetical protein
MQPQNNEITKIRSQETIHLIQTNPHISIIDDVEQQEDNENYRCFQHAVAKTTGFKDFLDFNKGNNFITQFFEQTNIPEKNDLVVYTTSEKDRSIQHFGIVIDDIIIESKWGNHSLILQHRLFDVPYQYGVAAAFFTLKKEYKTVKGKQLLYYTIHYNETKKGTISTIIPNAKALALATMTLTSGFIVTMIANKFFQQIKRL